MMNLPNNTKLVTVAEMQQIEAAADAVGHSYVAMMEMAGLMCADEIGETEVVASDLLARLPRAVVELRRLG